jgi:hypothetical protein
LLRANVLSGSGHSATNGDQPNAHGELAEVVGIVTKRQRAWFHDDDHASNDGNDHEKQTSEYIRSLPQP